MAKLFGRIQLLGWGSLPVSYTHLEVYKRQALRLAASVFEHAHEGIIITDATATIIEVNRTFEEITGYSREEVVGRNPRFLQSGHHDPAFYTTMWQLSLIHI